MIRVITIEREYGSGVASDIARKLAERLSWKLWDQDSLPYRLLKGFMLGSFEGTYAPRLNIVDADHILTVTRKLVTSIAQDGKAVIVGRGSAYHLQARTDAFHLLVYAPFEDRVRRLRAAGNSESDAIELAETVDRDRSEFIKQYLNIEWPARHFFDMMMNTKVGDELVVEAVLESVALFNKQFAQR
jgi:cytidylate kinase